MSALLENNVRVMLRAHLKTVAGLPAIAVEGIRFDPTIGTPYIREKLNPIWELPSANGTVSNRFVWNINVMLPAGLGTNELGELRGRIIAAFAPGTKLEYGGDAITVMEASRQIVLEEPDWLNGPVAITVQSWTLL